MNRPRAAARSFDRQLRRRSIVLTSALVVLSVLLLGVLAPRAHAQTFYFGIQSNGELIDGNLTAAQQAKTLNNMKAVGVQMIRVTMSWSRVAANPGACEGAASFAELENPNHACYNWTTYDNLVSLARARNIQVLASVYQVPDFANGTRDGTCGNYPESAFVGNSDAQFARVADGMAAFAKAAAVRYGPGSAYGRINYWTVGNEPNSPHFWCPMNSASPARFASLYRKAAPNIRAANSAARIAVGPTGPRPQHGYKPITYMKILIPRLGSNGSGPYIDAWAHNPYPPSLQSPRTKTTKSPAVGMNNLKDLFKLLDRYSVTRKKPVWATEFGYQSKPADKTFGVSESKQARFLGDCYDILESLGRVQIGIWYVYKDNTHAIDWQSGLVRSSGRKKPSWKMYQRPIAINKSKIKRGKIVRVWGASTIRRGSQKLQYSYSGKRGWHTLQNQVRDRQNGSVVALVRPGRSVWLRVKDRSGHGTKIKITVKR
jgi:hypothetical protein